MNEKERYWACASYWNTENMPKLKNLLDLLTGSSDLIVAAQPDNNSSKDTAQQVLVPSSPSLLTGYQLSKNTNTQDKVECPGESALTAVQNLKSTPRP